MIATDLQTALISTDPAGRHETGALLRRLGFDVSHVDGSRTLDDFASLGDSVALCLVDLGQNGEAMRLVHQMRSRYPQAVIIGIADPQHASAAAEAIRAGAFDVVPRPPSSSDLEALLSNAREQAALAASAPRLPDAVATGIAGSSAAMRSVADLVNRAAPGRCGILICGERGTGRETIARAIHARATRTGDASHAQPFVGIDCATPTSEEIELQLFGGVARRDGPIPERRSLERIATGSLVHAANGGILFLEHAADLPARVQARLVRVLRDREVFVDDRREPTAIDVRPIASSDAAIGTAVAEGRLRADLYERIALVRIDLPALRQRREDIPALAAHFLKDLCRANGRPVKTLTRAALTVLAALPWRGNIPELRAFLERLILLVPHGLIRLEDVLAHTQLEGSSISPTGLDATLRQARARFERDYIAAVLQHHHGRIADAARVLGIQRTNLYRKMRRLNLTKPKA